MEFIVTSRQGVESGIRVRSSYVVISIRDPDKRRAKVRKQSGLRGVLFLAFHDAEPTSKMVLPAAIKPMTPRQARQILRFFESHKAEIGAIVVHCEQGMSRSPGVAAALCKLMGGDDRKFWLEFQPNLHVYKLVLNSVAGG